MAAVVSSESIGLASAVSRGRVRTILLLLMLLYSLNYLDRQVINILAQSIKSELHLSDLQLGLLTGTAFGIFYSFLGLPIARLADKFNRVKIIGASLTLWSLLTVACGFSQSYAQLFATRLGVGVGEAGGTPPAQSLISDFFSNARRGTAMAVFNLGVPLGSFLGFLMGGFLNDIVGWRKALMVAGIPGLILVPIILRVIPEPARGSADGMMVNESVPRQNFRQSVRSLLDKPSFLRLILGGTFGIFVIYITGAWFPPLFIRLHGMTAGQMGAWMALCTGVGGTVGALGGGAIADAMKRRHPRAEIWVLMISTALTAPAMYIAAAAQNKTIALGALFILFTLGFVWMGPTSAMVQRVAPVRSRALATGIQLFVGNIIALALGPPLIGLASDLLTHVAGAQSLRWAMMGASIIGLFGTLCYGLAGRHILDDVEKTPHRTHE